MTGRGKFYGGLLSKRTSELINPARAAIDVGGTLVFARFSREDEDEADEEGFRYLVKAGISPEGMVSFFQKLLNEDGSGPPGILAWFSSHPLTQDRISNIQGMVNEVPPAILASLTNDTRAYRDFEAAVKALPPAPPPPEPQSEQPPAR